jgi:hypothetical protein
MPIISIFFGIAIRMFHNEHSPPHFHASYQGLEVLIRIKDGSVSTGSLPKRALRIVQSWCDRDDRRS